MLGETQIDIAFKFVECINRLDLDGLVSLMAEEYEFWGYDGKLHGKGRSQMTEGWKGYFTKWPDYMIHLCEVHEVGDEVILVGRTTGSHLEQPRIVEFPDTLIWAARIENGKVSQWRIYPDNEEVQHELGIVEKPANTI